MKRFGKIYLFISIALRVRSGDRPGMGRLLGTSLDESLCMHARRESVIDFGSRSVGASLYIECMF